MARKKAAKVVPGKAPRRGRPRWEPDLAQIEAAARAGATVEQIAQSLGVHQATLYRRMQQLPGLYELIQNARRMHRRDQLDAKVKNQAIGRRRPCLNRPGTDTDDMKESLDTRLDRIEARQQRIEQIIEQGDSRASAPAVGQYVVSEEGRLETSRPEPAATEASTPVSQYSYAAAIEQIAGSRRNPSQPGPSYFRRCRRCGQDIVGGEGARFNQDGTVIWHEYCARPHDPLYS
jgi:hypothetical protein